MLYNALFFNLMLYGVEFNQMQMELPSILAQENRLEEMMFFNRKHKAFLEIQLEFFSYRTKIIKMLIECDKYYERMEYARYIIWNKKDSERQLMWYKLLKQYGGIPLSPIP